MSNIKIDLNNPQFQDDFFALEKQEQSALIKTLKKIRKLNWDQLYIDNGLKWEALIAKQSKLGERIYSFRFSQKYRAMALRKEDFLCLLSLHVDHDSAYK